jgi:hypothetical protein
MFTRYALLLACFVFTLSAIPQQKSQASVNEPAPCTNADAYEVYSAILPLDWTGSAGAKRPIIDAETTSPELCLKPDAKSETIFNPILAEFKSLSESKWQLQPLFNLDLRYDLVPDEEILGFFGPGGGGWNSLLYHYPDSARSYIRLSPVAFNADKTIAIVYVGHLCGSQCGGGTFHVLHKLEGKWLPMKWNGTLCAWAA